MPAAFALAMPSSWRSRRRLVSNSANTPSMSRKHLPAAADLSKAGWASATAEYRAHRLNSILDVEASHLALSNTENVSDRLVFKPVRLPLQRFAFEIADGLPDLCDDRTIRSSM